MKKYLFLILLLIFTNVNSFCQVYQSEYLDFMFFFGPKNVDFKGNLIAEEFLKDYDNILMKINEENFLNDSILLDIKKKSNLSRPDKSKLLKLIQEKEKWDNEKAIINEFRESWIKKINEYELLNELFYLDSVGECVDIETESGYYSHFEYKILKESLNNHIYCLEYMQVSEKYHKGIDEIEQNIENYDHEIKVYDNSGKNKKLSAGKIVIYKWEDENEGIYSEKKVYHKLMNENENIEPGKIYSYIHKNGQIMEYNSRYVLKKEVQKRDCHMNYWISEDEKQCERELMYEINEKKDYDIKLISKIDGKELKLKSMIVLDCKD